MRRFDFKVIVFFVGLTVLLTVGVIALWEVTLRPPFFAWVDAQYPGDANIDRRWNIKQRVEHVAISFMVDALVVTLLLRLVHRQQLQLRTSEERYRALFEQARDGIGLVRVSDHRLVEANDRVCEILGVRQQDCINRDIRELFRLTGPHVPAELPMPNGQAAGESELTIQSARGQSVPVSLSCTPLSTEDREKVKLISLSDLSVRKQLEADREEHSAFARHLHFTNPDRPALRRHARRKIRSRFAIVRNPVAVAPNSVSTLPSTRKPDGARASAKRWNSRSCTSRSK